MSLYIKNITIVSMDPSIGTIYGGVLIEDGKIKKVINYSKCDDMPFYQADEIMDAKGMIMIPGMTNAHYHSYSNLLKGTANHLPLEVWSLYTVAYGHSLTDEDIYLAVLIGAAEMMRSGITSCIDHFPHLKRAEAALTAYEKAGIRVGFASMMHDVPDHYFLPVKLPKHLQEKVNTAKPWSVKQMNNYYRQLIQNWHQKNKKVEVLLGPNAPQRCSEDMLELCKRLSDEADLNVHTHLLETKIQHNVGRKRYEGGIYHRLKTNGLLNSKLSAAHAVYLNLEEIAQLKEKNVTIVHNPASNMTLGSGKAPITEYLNKKVSIALGTDASNCGGPHNMFETMRLAAMMHRLDEPNYEKWPQAEEVFQMATLGGAKAMGAEGKRGAISEGYAADLVLLKEATTTWSSKHNIINQLVFHENGQSVDSVMINGEWTIRCGKIVMFDEQSVINKIKERYETMVDSCSGEIKFAYELEPYFKEMYKQFHTAEKLEHI